MSDADESEIEDGVEQGWLAEIDRRVAQVESGASELEDWEDVRARLLVKLGTLRR